MRLIGQEVDALAEHQLNEFAGERLLTGLALKCRSRPTPALHSVAPKQTFAHAFAGKYLRLFTPTYSFERGAKVLLAL